MTSARTWRCTFGVMERMTGMLRGDYLGDGLLAVALTVFGQLNLRFNIDGSTRYGPTFATAATTALATAVIALRRRAPLLTVCVVTAAMAGPELVTRLTITLWGSFVPLVIAVYSVARHEKRRAAAAGAVVAALGVVVVMLRVPVIGTAANIPFTFVPCAGAFAAGRILRLRHDRHVEVSERARALEAGREETIRTAVEEERGRIARELHDIVAHCISVMVVQAGAAEDLLDRNPPLARPALQAVQETGRQAVTELTRMLGLLRGDRGALELRPQPGTAQLHELAESIRATGLPVTIQVQGTSRPLAPGLELTIYRVAQEALTNTLKHAGPARARIVLRYGEHTVELVVADDGRGPGPGAAGTPQDGQGTGHGLIGMRERATLYGGSLAAGPGPDGGFAVRMVLPVDGGPLADSGSAESELAESELADSGLAADREAW
jgi:signal transduction histidine kinase